MEGHNKKVDGPVGYPASFRPKANRVIGAHIRICFFSFLASSAPPYDVIPQTPTKSKRLPATNTMIIGPGNCISNLSTEVDKELDPTSSCL